jgi:HEAT repeat protein
MRAKADGPTHIEDVVAAEIRAASPLQSGEASLTHFRQPAATYYEIYTQAWAAMDDASLRRGSANSSREREVDPSSPAAARYEREAMEAGATFTRYYELMVAAEWGLIARGTDSIPYAMRMLKSPDSDIREGGAGVLQGIGQASSGVIDAVIESLGSEIDLQTRDTLVAALGAMKNKRAIPVLAALVKDSSIDADSQWVAIESLGKLVRVRFLTRPDPRAAAMEWIEAHPDQVTS